MPRLPRLRGREVIASLRRAGFLVLRIRGSHHFLQHPDGRRPLCPFMPAKQLGRDCWTRFWGTPKRRQRILQVGC